VSGETPGKGGTQKEKEKYQASREGTAAVRKRVNVRSTSEGGDRRHPCVGFVFYFRGESLVDASKLKRKSYERGHRQFKGGGKPS